MQGPGAPRVTSGNSNPGPFLVRLLLLSNSTSPGQPWLGWAAEAIRGFLADVPGEIVFLPFAGVTIGWPEYTERVRSVFGGLGIEVTSLAEASDPEDLIERAAGIVVGGGNTFALLAELYRRDLLEAIRSRVRGGARYLGWSAGANLACPTIRTTNDMPIVQPPSLTALGLVSFQINAHYTDATLPGHGGESRDDRLAEFVRVNPAVRVVGLREGSLLRVEDRRVLLEGKPARLFGDGEPREIEPGEVQAVSR